jgi:hypothetical protein
VTDTFGPEQPGRQFSHRISVDLIHVRFESGRKICFARCVAHPKSYTMRRATDGEATGL